MSTNAASWARFGLGALLAFATAGAGARVIDVHVNETRGVDPKVSYASLTEIGPWDDRNYQLTKEDLGYLSKEEYLAADPIPAFFRVWMRKGEIANGHPLPTEGMAQYPRSAVNIFLQRYGGIQIDGHTYRGIRRLDGNKYEVVEEDEAEEAGQAWPRFATGEVKITTPHGAEETAISVNPVDSNYVIAGSNGPGSGQKMWRSTDGGATWSSAISLSGNTCCDAAVGWSTDGSIAYTSTLINCGTSCGVAFYRSTDKGLTWTQSPLLVASGSDKEYLHVDSFPSSPYKDRVYVSWHQSNVQKFAYSTDKGATFSAVQTLDSGFKGIGSDLTSDKSGNVYYVFPSTTGKQIRVVKSTDGGATFPSVGTKVADTQTSFEYAIPAMPTRKAFIYAAADADLSGGPYANSIYVAWNDTYAPAVTTAASNHARIQVAYSRDGGATWTVTTPHPTSDQNTVDRFQQWMKVDSQGRVHVVWQDTQNASGRAGVDIYYSFSSDGAQTWSAPRRLTTVTSPNIVTSMEWGDYNGMDMAMNDIIAIFTGNRPPPGGGANSDDVWAVAGFADPMGPDYSVQLGSSSQAVCAGSSLTPVQISMNAFVGYNRPVTLSLPGLNTSAFTGGLFTPNPVTPASPPATASLTLGTQPTAARGSYVVTVRGTDNQSPAVVKESTLNVQIASGQPVVPALTAPANGATNAARSPSFTWSADPAAVDYTIEVASDAAFTTIVASGTVTATSWTPSAPLQPMTTYYWRVRANSPCGNSASSPASSFTTGVTFPEPYCAVTFPSGVEPITHVVIGGIDNRSTESTSASAHEDFTGIIGTLTAGASSSFAVEGNTNGNFKTYVSVYIDWNRNGTFDTGENFDIGVISNSTGIDGQQATGMIAVPAGALPGNTRMRVIKKYSSTVAYPAACNTAGFGQAEDYTVTVVAGGPTYTVGGTVSGTTGTGLKLKLNGGTDYAVAGNGTYTFPTALPDSSSYAVTVSASPAGQSCAVTGGSGTISGANVTTANVSCTTLPTYTVGGQVSGLSGTGLTLKLNGSSDLAVSANGAFTFSGGLTSGTAYAVTVGTQPLGQACSIANGSGTMGSANVTNVAVTCAVVSTYTVGGTVSGLSGSGLTLKLNGGSDLAIAASGAFTFSGGLTSGTAYAVTVGTQPSGQTCSVAGGSGTMGSANVSNVAVTCADNAQTYTVGGQVRGMTGPGLALKLNGGSPLTMSANGLYAFPDSLASGATYVVTVATQPTTTPPQTCTVVNGAGTIGAANVTNVDVNCANDVLDRIFMDGFESSTPPGVTLTEGFDDITTLAGAGWIQKNNSTSGGTTNWFQGNDTVFSSYDGASTAYIGANFHNTGDIGTISNWLVTPLLTFDASSSIAFHTRSKIATDGVSVYADRVEVRLCTGASCTDVGSTPTAVGQFTTLLRSVNPNLGSADDPAGVNGYPLSNWAPFTLDAAAGLPASGQGRIAFRYYVTSAGANGSNSNFIGIDNVQIHAAVIGSAAGVAPSGGITVPNPVSTRAR